MFDSSHLTFEYSRLLAPVMGALADRRARPTVDKLRDIY